MVEGGTPNTLLRRGITRESLKVGTVLVIDGYQARDHSLLRANGRNVTYPDGKKLFLGSSGTGAPTDGSDPTRRRRAGTGRTVNISVCGLRIADCGLTIGRSRIAAGRNPPLIRIPQSGIPQFEGAGPLYMRTTLAANLTLVTLTAALASGQAARPIPVPADGSSRPSSRAPTTAPSDDAPLERGGGRRRAWTKEEASGSSSSGRTGVRRLAQPSKGHRDAPRLAR